MNVPILVSGKNKTADQGGIPVTPSARVPEGEAEIFLTVAAQQVFASDLV
jgi:hypothetical protein